MIEQIKELFNRYYNLRRIIADMYIFRSRGQQIVNVFPNLHAVKWNLWLYGDSNVPDIARADDILNKEKLEIAIQIYDLALRSLEYKDKKGDWDKIYGKAYIDINNPQEMISYSQGAFFWLGILTPYEYDISEPQIDETGKLLGMKLKPKEKPEGILKEIDKYAGEIEEES